MVFQKVNELSFEDAKKLTEAIIGVINEFLDSVENLFPGIGYGDFAKSLTSFQSDIESSTKASLSSSTINEYATALFDTFTTMNPDLENNLQKLFNAYKEVSHFIFTNNADIEFRLLDFEDSRINDIKKNNEHQNNALSKIKESGYTDETSLRALFSIFSSIIETSEQLHREELINYRNNVNEYSRNNQLGYNFPFNPVDVFSIGDVVQRRGGGSFTKQRALRHLIDHHHFKIDSDNFTIHFKSPDDPQWQFNFDETFTFQKFCEYLGSVDAFYKSAVCLMFSFQLLGVLREHFEQKITFATRLKMQYLLNHLNQHPYFSK